MLNVHTRSWGAGLRLLVVSGCLVMLSGCKSSDSPTIPDDGMGGDVGMRPGPVACESDGECDDRTWCNGQERCVSGFCRSGTRVDCDDEVECTEDRCDEDAQECIHTGPDADDDGHLDANCRDADGQVVGDDCDDEDPLRYPGAIEVCDPDYRDEDCDPTTIGERDKDRDGYNDAQCCNEDADGELSCGQDCDDVKPTVNPESVEVCDHLDNNCNGEVDEGVSITAYPDLDYDGHGDSNADPIQACPSTVGVALVQNDCDDTDPEVFVGQFEICDGKDNNCDPLRLADEIKQQAPWYPDDDGDTFGDPNAAPVYSCYRIPGRVLSYNDCDDTTNKVRPGGTELCDALDNDCNGWADAPAGGVNDFEDDDGDLVADAACGGDDCDDTDARTALGAEEVCDRIDNDCDGEVDEQTTQNIWYIDKDGDGWGVVIGSALASCDPIPNRATNFGDCNDDDASVRPNAAERCDGIDNDCDGLIDEGSSSACKLDNATSVCASGACQVGSCHPGYSDETNANGCETPVNIFTGIGCTLDSECDDQNVCNGVETCQGGQCILGAAINCNAGASVILGSVTIDSPLDIVELSGVTIITGDLIIDSTSLISIGGLEALQMIGGSLIITNNAQLVNLAYPGLSNLHTVGNRVLMQNNPALIRAGLPGLLSAGGIEIVVGTSTATTGIEFGSLIQVHRDFILDSQAPNLRTIYAPVLSSAGGIDLLHSPGSSRLDVIDLASLSVVEGALSIEAPITGTGAQSGLFLDSLVAIGTNDADANGSWDNDGPLTLVYGDTQPARHLRPGLV